MALIYSPKIVTDGLVFCADAGNKKSYPGSGFFWYDLSVYKDAGLLTTGAFFRQINGGLIEFTDSSSNGSVVDFGTANLNLSSMSVEYFFKITSDPDLNPGSATNYFRYMALKSSNFFNFLEESRYINFTVFKGGTQFRRMGDSTPGIFGHGLTPGGDFSGDKFEIGSWYHIVFTYDSSDGRGYYYANGNLINSGLMRIQASPYTAITPGSIDNTTSSLTFSSNDISGVEKFFPGYLAIWRIYNKSLSADEVKQNYNATKSRFSL